MINPLTVIPPTFKCHTVTEGHDGGHHKPFIRP